MDRASPTQSIEGLGSCRHLGRSRRYQFNHDALDPLCVQRAILYRPVCHRALRTALVAGMIYTAQYAVSALSVLQANRLP